MAYRTSKIDGKTVTVKKFLKCFDESATFIVLTDPESEEAGDYETGANSNIIFTLRESFLLSVNHGKTPNTTYREVQGFPSTAEIQITGHLYMANKVHLKPALPFTEAPFLNDPKFFRYIHYEYNGASYLIKNSVPIPEDFTKYLLSKDDNLIKLIPDISREFVQTLIDKNPHRVRYFSSISEFRKQAVTKAPYTLQYFLKPLPTDEEIEIALSKNGTAIRFVPDPTPEQCEHAVKQTYMAIQHVPKSKRTKALLTLTQSLLEADKETNIDFESLIK